MPYFDAAASRFGDAGLAHERRGEDSGPVGKNPAGSTP